MLRLRYRLPIAFLIGILSTIVSHKGHTEGGFLGGDFTWVWYGAKALLAGENPYHNPLFQFGNAYPFDQPLLYPLPAVIVTVPFSLLPVEHAASLFIGLSSALLAFVVMKDGLYRLGLFLSAPFFVAATLAQWSPLLMVILFVPALLPLSIVKPNLAITLTAAVPSIRGIILSGVLLLLTLAILPTWPFDWLANVRAQLGHGAALRILPAPLILLALIHWRRRDARLLVASVVVPQLLFFADQLLLFMIPKTLRQMLFMCFASWLGLFAWAYTLPGGYSSYQPIDGAPLFIVLSIYFPALILVFINARTEAQSRGQTAVQPSAVETSAWARIRTMWANFPSSAKGPIDSRN